MSTICLLSIVGPTSAFNTRDHGGRDSANASVQENRVTSPRDGSVVVSSGGHAIQVTGGGLYTRISRFVSGRGATLRRLLVGRCAAFYLNDRCRRSTRRIQDRSQPKDVNGNRSKAISGQLSLVTVLYQGGGVVSSLFRFGARATRAFKGGARVFM